MISTPLLQLIFFPVHNDGGDLLVHEYEDGSEECGKNGHQGRPSGVAVERVDYPSTIRKGGLEFSRDFELWRVDANIVVEEGHR